MITIVHVETVSNTREIKLQATFFFLILSNDTRSSKFKLGIFKDENTNASNDKLMSCDLHVIMLGL